MPYTHDEVFIVKKRFFIIIGLLLASVFVFSACGNSCNCNSCDCNSSNGNNNGNGSNNEKVYIGSFTAIWIEGEPANFNFKLSINSDRTFTLKRLDGETEQWTINGKWAGN